MVDVPSVSIVIASAGVMVAATYYVLQIRHQTKMRQTDLIMRLYSTWGDESLQKACLTVVRLEFNDYDDYVKKYRGSGVIVDWFRVAWFYNGIGVLLQSKLVDAKLVDKLFGYIVILMWEKLKPIIEGEKEREEAEPRALEWFEYLYNEMKKREQAGAKNG